MPSFNVTMQGYRFRGAGPSLPIVAGNAREACAQACSEIEASDLPLAAGRRGRDLGAFDLDNCAPETGWWRYAGDGWRADVVRA